MQNDRNRHSFGAPRHARTPSGRSCPASLGIMGGGVSERPIPDVNDSIGGRLCDGSLPRGEAVEDMSNCGTQSGGWGLHSYPLAMAYSPLQEFREVYSPDVALERGTIFPELDLPFEGRKGRKGGIC